MFDILKWLVLLVLGLVFYHFYRGSDLAVLAAVLSAFGALALLIEVVALVAAWASKSANEVMALLPCPSCCARGSFEHETDGLVGRTYRCRCGALVVLSEEGIWTRFAQHQAADGRLRPIADWSPRLGWLRVDFDGKAWVTQRPYVGYGDGAPIDVDDAGSPDPD